MGSSFYRRLKYILLTSSKISPSLCPPQMTVGGCLRVILAMALVSLLFASPIFLNTHFHIPILDHDTTAAAATAATAVYESRGTNAIIQGPLPYEEVWAH